MEGTGECVRGTEHARVVSHERSYGHAAEIRSSAECRGVLVISTASLTPASLLQDASRQVRGGSCGTDQAHLRRRRRDGRRRSELAPATFVCIA